jgi:hypothetical protein
VEIAGQARSVGECERITDERPGDADESDRDIAHHHGVERILCPHHSTVKESQRRCHHEHQRGGYQHPRSVGRAHGIHGRLI